MNDLDLDQIASDLHDARFRDSAMADWARKWGQKLIQEIENVRAPQVIEPDPSDSDS